MARARRLLRFAKDLKCEAADDDLTGLAAELAFRFFMALFPFVLVLVTAGALLSRLVGVDDPSQYVIDAVGDSLPADASSVLQTQVDEVIKKANLGVLSLGLATASWSAAGGAKSLMKATNRVYDLPETRKPLVQTGVALALILLGGTGLLVAVMAIALSQAFAGAIASALGVGREFGWAVQVLRLPLIVVFVAAAVQTVYWLAPNRWTRPGLGSPGAAVFAVTWSAFTVGFAFYVTNFGSYNATYGAIAGVVILLFWFYVSALLILLGAEINAMGQIGRETLPAEEEAHVPAMMSAKRATSPGVSWLVWVGVTVALISWLRHRPVRKARD